MDFYGYHKIFTDIGMGWWLVGTTAAVAGLVLTLELSQISEDYSMYMNNSETQPRYDIVAVEDSATQLSFWERRFENDQPDHLRVLISFACDGLGPIFAGRAPPTPKFLLVN